ncbi:MAG: RNA pseudouridine synthase [Bacteroidota bacterium]
MNLQILHEGHRWVAVNKPAGIGVEKHYNYDTVEKRAYEQFRREGATKLPYVGIIHRLDRPVSGVLLLARNKTTLTAFNKIFAAGEVQKTYLALCTAPPPEEEGSLRHFLLKDKYGKKAIAARRPLPNAKEAKLTYRFLDEIDGRYWLEVKPHTGKFHQIRVQLAAIGCPIWGDALYGSMLPFHSNQIALHAQTLHFTPPNGEETITINAEIPSNWQTV